VSDQNPSAQIPSAEATTAPVEPVPAVATEAELAEPAIAAKPAELKEGGDGPDAADQQVVFVNAPLPPRKKGNRIVGSLFSLLAAVVYGAVFAGVIAIISLVLFGRISVNFLAAPTFYVPIVFFLIGMILVVLVVNRAGWWSYLIGSIFVALVVYFGTVGFLLLLEGVVAKTPAAASLAFQHGLQNPLVIAAALIAREIAIWTGAVIGRRGKKVTVRNAAARDAFDHEQAELAAT
jgi:hypothetical protein